jgi:hypothetical protein
MANFICFSGTFLIFILFSRFVQGAQPPCGGAANTSTIVLVLHCVQPNGSFRRMINQNVGAKGWIE